MRNFRACGLGVVSVSMKIGLVSRGALRSRREREENIVSVSMPPQLNGWGRWQVFSSGEKNIQRHLTPSRASSLLSLYYYWKYARRCYVRDTRMKIVLCGTYP